MQQLEDLRTAPSSNLGHASVKEVAPADFAWLCQAMAIGSWLLLFQSHLGLVWKFRCCGLPEDVELPALPGHAMLGIRSTEV